MTHIPKQQKGSLDEMDEWLLDASIAELDVEPATAHHRAGETRSRVVYAVVPLADIDSNQEGYDAWN